MGSKHERKIVEGAGAFLEPGEDVLAAIVASPRGHSQRAAGVRPLGAIQQRRVSEQVGLRRGVPIVLEANAAASASDLADALARAKTEGRERFGNALPGS
ncbi:MAG: hypothetical protein QOD13_2867 [Thermoleophilaceae bacterium]|jgi:hypothetical protein|nr:hypothetical protein [Thermoleophilaceae bacterium]